eukprot:Amastigsp_a677275_4.p3 type:complete len:111 gc:universal Amastigsp_a677275_4:1350-1018(-)
MPPRRCRERDDGAPDHRRVRIKCLKSRKIVARRTQDRRRHRCQRNDRAQVEWLSELRGDCTCKLCRALQGVEHHVRDEDLRTWRRMQGVTADDVQTHRPRGDRVVERRGR